MACTNTGNMQAEISWLWSHTFLKMVCRIVRQPR